MLGPSSDSPQQNVTYERKHKNSMQRLVVYPGISVTAVVLGTSNIGLQSAQPISNSPAATTRWAVASASISRASGPCSPSSLHPLSNGSWFRRGCTRTAQADCRPLQRRMSTVRPGRMSPRAVDSLRRAGQSLQRTVPVSDAGRPAQARRGAETRLSNSYPRVSGHEEET